MSAASDVDYQLASWALPLGADERAIWDALPRDEQVRRMRELFGSNECQTVSTKTFDEIIAYARERATSR